MTLELDRSLHGAVQTWFETDGSDGSAPRGLPVAYCPGKVEEASEPVALERVFNAD